MSREELLRHIGEEIVRAQEATAAFETGFKSQSHFTTVFRRATGLTPARVRRAAR